MQGGHSLLVVSVLHCRLIILPGCEMASNASRKGWDLFLNGEKDPDCADGKKAKRIVTLVVLVYCKFTLKSLLFVSKACLSVQSGRIMRSLSLSFSLSFSGLCQSDFMQIKEELVQLKAFVWEEPLPIHPQRCCNQRGERERERECHHSLQPFKPSENGHTGASSNTFIYSTHSSSSNYFTNSTSTLLTGQNVLRQLAFLTKL